jgi:hypothetical protein
MPNKTFNWTHTAVAVFAKTKSGQKQRQPMRQLTLALVALSIFHSVYLPVGTQV